MATTTTTPHHATRKRDLVAIARRHGCASLLGIDADAKTRKGTAQGVTTGIMYLQPSDALCPMSTIAGCRAPCLVTAGRAAFTPGIGAVRAARTAWLQSDPATFLEFLISYEIPRVVRTAKRLGNIPAVRLNGTSDINWTNVTHNGRTVFEHFPEVTFYDYTKSPAIIRAAAGETNWHITASYSGASDHYARLITAAATKYGANLAVVFRTGDHPTHYLGRPVVNGDETDLRFKDPAGVVVALKAKGQARKDASGFVVDTAPALIASDRAA